ncbi:MAG TPA: polyhydroxyalkanoic acid system family protein [Kofleriaceae bacterium]
MEIDFPYAPLSDDEARSRLDILGKYLANKHGIKVSWLEASKARFSGKYLVVKIEGELTIGNGRAKFHGEDPGFLWRGKAKEYIQGKLAAYLNPKTPIEQLPES